MLQMKQVKAFFAGAAAVFMLALSAVAVTQPSLVFAATPKDEVLCGVGAATGGAGCNPAGGGVSIERVVRVVLQIISLIAGIIAVIMVMVAGLKYITSSGDSASVTSAKNTLLYAVVGIIVVVFSQLIVKFVLDKVK